MQPCKVPVKNDSFRYLKILCEDGRLDDAIRAADSLHRQSIPIPIHAFFCLLRSCISKKDLGLGRKLHSLIKKSGLESNAFLASHLIRMFSTCRSLSDATEIFIKIPTHRQTVFTWNAIISAYVKLGQHVDAIKFYDHMHRSYLHPDRHIFTAVLKACTCKNTLQYGRRIHSHIVEHGSESDLVVGNTLVAMYVKSGSIDDAHLVFAMLPEKNVVTWNAMMSGYAHHGHGRKTLHSLLEMHNDGLEPTIVTFVCVLKACASIVALYEGMHIHVLIMKRCLEQDAFMGNSLIDMYAKCGSLEDAHDVFEKLLQQDVATWNAMIGAYAQHGLGKDSMELFNEMQLKGIKPDNVTFLSVLKACASITDLDQGELIETHISRCGFKSDAYVASTLIDMYVKCGSIEHAGRVFNSLPNRDIVIWNTMIGGCAQHGQCQEALQLFQQMQQEGMEADEVTFVSLLRVISSTGSLELGKLIHACILGAGLESEAFVENSIIDLYAKFGSIEDAHTLFDRLPKQDAVPWNAMISGHVQHQQGQEALQLFYSMQQEGLEPDKVTFVSVLRGCSSMAALDHGKLVHARVIESGCELDVLIGNTLIDMYAKCGSINNAMWVFTKATKQDVLTWNALISGYVHCQQGQNALQAFEKMQQKAIQPNETTFISVLQACSSLEALEPNKLVHDLIIKNGLELDVYIMSTLIDVYAKCGNMEEAICIFYSLPKPGVVTWTGMISGHVLHGDGQEALQLFYQMQLDGIEPNQATFVCALKACIILAGLDQGKLVHGCIIRKGFASDEVVGSALIDMYSTCGSMKDAYKVFVELPNQDMVTWSAIITGFALCNDYEMALQQFKEMQREGLQPDVVTFVSLLSACSHMGLMDEGFHIFESIGGNHGIVPTVDHLNCVVDLLGRAGQLSKAEDLLQAFPLLCSSLGWRSLLGHCQTHGNVELGRRCFDRLVRLGNATAAVYKLMSNIYSRAGMWEDAEIVEGLRLNQNAWKKPGKALVEVKSRIHDFVVGDKSHVLSYTTFEKLDRLILTMKEEGYMPCLDSFPEQQRTPATAWLATSDYG